MKNIITLLISLLMIFAFLGCTKKNPNVLIKTNLGNIRIEIFENDAPITAKNFLRYVDENRFSDACFYRVVRMDNQPTSKIKIEVIQGGLFEDFHPDALKPIKHETTKETGILHKDGVISMARLEPGTATSEFFICVGDQPKLDFDGDRNPDRQGFAAFGKVVEGMDVVRKIQQLNDKEQMLVDRLPITEIERIK